METVHFSHTSRAAILSTMKTPSMPKTALSLVGPGILLVVLLVAGGLAGRALAVPLPALGVVLVLLALRLGVMAAAIEEPTAPRAQPVRTGAGARKPALHAARG